MSVQKILVVFFCLFLFAQITQAASVSILCYHSFWGNPKHGYDFSHQEVRAQLNFFRRNGFKFISYQDLLSGNVTGNRNILVTIDDGNRSVYKAYRQVFKPYKIKPVFAIYPGNIGRSPIALNWWQVEEFLKAGCEVSSHGYNHLFVAQKLYNKNREAFNREIYTSKAVLEKKLKRPVTTFTYPFGVLAPITVKNVKQAGYHYAFGVQPQPTLLPLEHNTHIYELPRYLFTRHNRKTLMHQIVKDVETLELKRRVLGN